MEEYKTELLKKLRKITVDKPEFGYKVNIPKIQKWILNTIEELDENEMYTKIVLKKLSENLKNGDLIPSYFYYQVEFLFGGGKF